MQLHFLKKKFIVALILLAAFSVGYIRETVFVVINSVLNNYQFPYNPSYLKPPPFLYELSTDSLIMLKWALTLLFSLVFMGITLFLVNFYFKSKSFNKLIIITYSVLFAISLVISLLGFLFNQFDTFYAISRFIAGLLQYPLLTMIMFTMFYFINTLHNERKIS